MNRLIRTILATNGKLYAIAAGQRHSFAYFNGKIEITEHTTFVPLLGTIQKGTKTIIASVIVCGDLEYKREITSDFIHSGKVYEAEADIGNESFYFAGLMFEDSDPEKNELIFRITDMELIQKLLMISQ